MREEWILLQYLTNPQKKIDPDRPTCVFIGSFSINEVAIFGCVIDKQYDSMSDLIISFGTAKNQITFYRCKYWNTKYINLFLAPLAVGHRAYVMVRRASMCHCVRASIHLCVRPCVNFFFKHLL